MFSRRDFIRSLSTVPLAASLPLLASSKAAGARAAETITAYLEQLRKPTGGYGWASATYGHITPTFAVVGCYRLLGLPVPNTEAVAKFARYHYPLLPEWKRKTHALRVFDYQQVQTLLWLGQSVDSLDSIRSMAAQWTQPQPYTKYMEFDGYPILEYEALTLRVRALAGVEPRTVEPAWRAYFAERRRPNGTYNNTPASDGSDGNLMNTLWATWALRDMHEADSLNKETFTWIERCQLPSGGFTYSPHPPVGGLDNLVYTWGALRLLNEANHAISRREECSHWVLSLLTPEGGFQGRPDSLPNPMATYYALDSLRLLEQEVENPRHRAPAIRRTRIPPDMKVFSAQIEAPGEGSPSEAVYLAEKLGIDLWAAKNSPAGWISATQRVARSRGVHTLFAVGNEEHGIYVKVPGLGAYSHLDDWVAPPHSNLGHFPPKKNMVEPWPRFRDSRLRQIRQANGRMVWQFNENEALSRGLLDEAVVTKTYAAISAFHYGLGNFLVFEPFLMDYSGRIPMVGLQDAHGHESWWWASSLASFRTLFIARDATWPSFVEAIDKRRVLAVRHDRFTKWRAEYTGALPGVREFVEARQDSWCWWGKAGASRSLPPAVLTVLRPGMFFETGCPSQGMALRLRLADDPDDPGKAAKTEPTNLLTEFISMEVDGKPVQPKLVLANHDAYYFYVITNSSAKTASAAVRSLRTGKEETLKVEL